jgi:hypothetical protein
MNIGRDIHGPSSPARHGPERGSAVLIVLILLSIMAVLVAANTILLRELKVELQRLDQKQQRKFQTPAPKAPAPASPTR